jgi:Na+/phosphate symporter
MSQFPDIAFACVLGLAALLAALVGSRARPVARDYLNFAAALYGALALADLAAALDPQMPAFAAAVTLVIAALAPCALMLAFAAAFARAPSPWIAAPLLAAALAAGIFAAATNAIFVAFAPLFACLCAMLALAARHARQTRALYAAVAALALLAAAASFMTGTQGRTAFALFSAAGLMGASLACVRRSRQSVEHQRPRRVLRLTIGERR